MTAKHRWSRRLIVTAVGVALVFVALRALALLTPVHQGPASSHFDGKHFSNVPVEDSIKKSFFEILRWSITREPGFWAERRDTVYYSPPRNISDGLRVTFVNHATVLIQTGGVNILTDPMWSKRASPVGWMGPARFRDPGMRIADLPPIDAVLISHNHYDHMDMPSIVKIAEMHDPQFYVPLGNARYLERAGVDNVMELDWWQTATLNRVELHAVPAQHWSRRGVYDTNRALWAGYVIMSDSGPVYFAGDSGMGGHFAEISARLGRPRLALFPIGAYLPRWFMAKQHIDPAEAVFAHVLMDAEESMAIHFGTFRLGDDGQDQAVRDLYFALRRAEIPAAQFWIPGNGDSRFFESNNESVASIAAR
ncbi:MAG: MBL fold metallo-hydrolase [Gammaproteobacteria bacterium]|nr:MBL fold metallo-hydrolase [Gammaproteobacteria bacterium]MDH3768029.1 MBL fold metallo-hydrolase [Gammaproteobacteria bacterium]